MKRIKGTLSVEITLKEFHKSRKELSTEGRNLKLLIDPTYLLPAIGISIKGLPNDVLIKLLKDMQIPVEQESAMSE
jgi:hypothetical protein